MTTPTTAAALTALLTDLDQVSVQVDGPAVLTITKAGQFFVNCTQRATGWRCVVADLASGETFAATMDEVLAECGV